MHKLWTMRLICEGERKTRWTFSGPCRLSGIAIRTAPRRADRVGVVQYLLQGCVQFPHAERSPVHRDISANELVQRFVLPLESCFS